MFGDLFGGKKPKYSATYRGKSMWDGSMQTYTSKSDKKPPKIIELEHGIKHKRLSYKKLY